MNIKIENNGMWGGFIPDALRSGTIIIRMKNLSIELDKDEFNELRTCLEEKIQELFNQAQEIVKSYDKRSQLLRDYKELFDGNFKNVSAEELHYNFIEFYSDYWDV
jgi:hypothetical protein